MSQLQLQRYHLIRMVIDAKASLAEAAETINVSCRQSERIKAYVTAEGATGVLHHDHGRTPANTLSDELRQRVQELSQDAMLGSTTPPSRRCSGSTRTYRSAERASARSGVLRANPPNDDGE